MEQILGKGASSTEAHSPGAARQSSFRQQSSATRGSEQQVGTLAHRMSAQASPQTRPVGHPPVEIFCSMGKGLKQLLAGLCSSQTLHLAAGCAMLASGTVVVSGRVLALHQELKRSTVSLVQVLAVCRGL